MDTNMAAISLFRDTNMAAVTSCENTPFDSFYGVSHAIKCHAFLIHVTLGLTMLGEKHTGNVCPDMLKTKNKLKTTKSLPKCGQDR